MVSTNRIKWDDTANRLTAYCSDDTGETELGPVKWDDTNNKLELNCDSTDFQAKWDDAGNTMEARSVADACCPPTPSYCIENPDDCSPGSCCGSDCDFDPDFIKVVISGVSDCPTLDGDCTDVNGTWIVTHGGACQYDYDAGGIHMQLQLDRGGTPGINVSSWTDASAADGLCFDIEISQTAGDCDLCDNMPYNGKANECTVCLEESCAGTGGTVSVSLGL